MKPEAKAVLISTGVVLGLCAAVALSAHTPPAEAARNTSGTMSLYTPGNPVTTGSAISSTWANNTLTDIASEITNSLDRNGRGSMSAALKLYAGTVSAPGLAFSSETSSGLYRAGAGDVRMSMGGTAVQQWTATGVSLTSTALFRNSGGFGYLHGPAAMASPTTANYSLLMDGSANTILNAPTGGAVSLRINGSSTPLFVDGSGTHIGSTGTAISASYGGTYSITEGAMLSGVCDTTAETLTGVSVGGVCVVSTDSELGATGNKAVWTDCYVSAANTVVVRICNASGSSYTFPALNFRVRVFQP